MKAAPVRVYIGHRSMVAFTVILTNDEHADMMFRQRREAILEFVGVKY